MAKTSEVYATLDAMLTEAARRGVLHHFADEMPLDGRHVQIKDRKLLQFGSCGYLGLELDERLKQGAIEAVMRYGTQFSSSRAYMSGPLYARLEELLEAIFESPTLVAPTTTLAHLSALPVLIEEDDVVVLDQQVHNSVQLAVNQVRIQGTKVEMIRHSRLDLLEERYNQLRHEHRRIWYMVDGVYSMFGDLAPMEQLWPMLERCEQLHLYIDDAHGMSWAGRCGRGTVLAARRVHERMIVVTSMAKGFGCGGGIITFPNAELLRKVRTCGPPMIFSGPLQPPILGAAVASAQIHLSSEIEILKSRLRERQELCNRLLAQYGLPLVSLSPAPIRYIGMGLPRVAYAMAERLQDEGFYTNVAIFPAVPIRSAGIRFTLTLHMRLDDIRLLVEAIARNLPQVLAAEGSSLDMVHKVFNLAPVAPSENKPAGAPRNVSIGLRIEHATSITSIDQHEWDALLGANGSYTWEGLRYLEETFQENAEPENNWNFHYYRVLDESGTPVLATFFTSAQWKDDMIESAAVSQRVEALRRDDPSFLTSHTLAMGSLFTEGMHLYLDRARDWRKALSLLFPALGQEQERSGAKNLVLRDLPTADQELSEFLSAQGFVKVRMPVSLVLEMDWTTEAELYQRLSRKAKQHQRNSVWPFNDTYEIEVLRSGGREPSREEYERFYELYLNVKRQNLALNTFDLPKTVFVNMLKHPCWELVLFYPKSPLDVDPRRAVGIMGSFVGPEQYAFLIVGMDYRYVRERGLYRQTLRQALLRTQHHGRRRVLLGMDAALEKRRFGAVEHQRQCFVQVTDHYNLERLAQIRADVRGA